MVVILEVITVVKSLYDNLKEKKDELDDMADQADRLCFHLQYIEQCLQLYEDLTLGSDNRVIDQLHLTLEETSASLDSYLQVSQKGQLCTYFCVNSQIKDFPLILKQAKEKILLAFNQFEDYMNILKMSSEMSEPLKLEALNREAMEELKECREGLIFWSRFVKKKSKNIPTSLCTLYMQRYVITFNSRQEEQSLRVDLRTVPDLVQRLMAQRGSEKISIQDIGRFFRNFWCQPQRRKEANLIVPCQPEVSEEKYALLRQFCQEIYQEVLMVTFLNKQFDSKALLETTYVAFLNMFSEEVQRESLGRVWSLRERYLQQVAEYDSIQRECLLIQHRAQQVFDQVVSAEAQGRLHKHSRPDGDYFIEDPVQGMGLCKKVVYSREDNSQVEKSIFSRRFMWESNYQPGVVKYEAGQVNIYTELIGDHWDFGYVCRVYEDGKTSYAQVCDKDTYSMRIKKVTKGVVRMGLKLKADNKYHFEGEVLQLDGLGRPSKAYYKHGKAVDWLVFRKISVAHLLDPLIVDQLKQRLCSKGEALQQVPF